MIDQEKTSQAPAVELIQQITALTRKSELVAAKIQDLQKELEATSLKIATYVDAGKLVFGGPRFQALLNAAAGGQVGMLSRTTSGTVGGLFQIGEDLLKRRSLSESWARLLSSVSGQDTFGYDDLEMMADVLGYEISKAGMRSQVKVFVDDELLERVSNGTFRVTQKGLAVAEEALGKATAQRPALVAAIEEVSDEITNPLGSPTPERSD